MDLEQRGGDIHSTMNILLHIFALSFIDILPNLLVTSENAAVKVNGGAVCLVPVIREVPEFVSF